MNFRASLWVHPLRMLGILYLFSFILFHSVFILLTGEGGTVHAVLPSHHYQSSTTMSSGSIHNTKISITTRLKSWLGFKSFASSGVLRNQHHSDDSLIDDMKIMDGNVGVNNMHGSRGWVPPTLLFLLSSSSSTPVSASPLNPQSISLSGPFFQGWLLRTVDHRVNTSFILIIGSFARNSNQDKNKVSTHHSDRDNDGIGNNRDHSTQRHEYDEHYIFCGL